MPPPLCPMTGHVTPPAQRHHVERIAVVLMVQLLHRPPAVLAPVAHVQQPQLPQMVADLPRVILLRSALALPPCHLAQQRPVLPAPALVDPPRLGSLLRAAALLRPRSPRELPVLLGVPPVTLPSPRAATRLAVPAPVALGKVQIEPHQVLLLAADRAHLRPRVLGIGRPILRPRLRNPQPLPHLPSAPSRPRPFDALAHCCAPIVGSSLARSPHTVPLLNAASCSLPKFPPERLRHTHATCA